MFAERLGECTRQQHGGQQREQRRARVLRGWSGCAHRAVVDEEAEVGHATCLELAPVRIERRDQDIQRGAVRVWVLATAPVVADGDEGERRLLLCDAAGGSLVDLSQLGDVDRRLGGKGVTTL
jgi:hypothetical protein